MKELEPTLLEDKKIDTICAEYNLAWASRDTPPPIEEFVQRIDETMREKLACMLIAIDVDHRRKKGETPTPEIYEQRLNLDSKLVQAVFAIKDTQNNRDDLTIPSEINNYEILELIGKGGMGEVYLARHKSWQSRQYAVKFIRRKFFEDDQIESALSRFEKEIQAMEGLQHPNIAQAIDTGRIGGEPYLVMEYIDGADLQRLVSSRFPNGMPIAESCEIIRQSATGLQFAMEQGIIHRDIKPSNLMVSHEGRVYVLDLGLARILEHGGATRLTSAGQHLGTPDYMAPEQWQDNRQVGSAADVYGLGCTLWCLLTGAPPFAGGSSTSHVGKMYAHVMTTPGDIRKRRSDVPKKLAKIVARCLSKNPDSRYATPGELATALNEFCHGANLSSLVESTAQPVPQSQVSTQHVSHQLKETQPDSLKNGSNRSFRPRWLIGAALCLLLMALAYAGWVWLFPTDLATVIRVRRVEPTGFSYWLLEEPRGFNNFSARVDDIIGVDIQLSRPKYCYLVALTPSNYESERIQELYAPQKTVAIQFAWQESIPGNELDRFTLNAGPGPYAILLFSSEGPFESDRNSLRRTIHNSPWNPQVDPANLETAVYVVKNGETTMQTRLGGPNRGPSPPQTRIIEEVVNWAKTQYPNVSVDGICFPVLPKIEPD